MSCFSVLSVSSVVKKISFGFVGIARFSIWLFDIVLHFLLSGLSELEIKGMQDLPSEIRNTGILSPGDPVSTVQPVPE